MSSKPNTIKKAIKRLKHRKEFLYVARQGKKWVTPNMVVQAQSLPKTQVETDFAYVGFTVTKKIGNAVCRNRLRRRLKSAAIEALPSICENGQKIVIIGRHKALKSSFEGLVGDLIWAMKNLKERRSAKHT